MAKKNSSGRDINLLQMQDMFRELSNENTAKTFAFNQAEAQKERDWSQMMSDTSHQREVEDLKKAGLNPVLSSNSGAQSYSGASASGQADSSAIGVLASIFQTKMNNDNAVKLAKMQNKNNLEMAKISAAASNYAANTSAGASQYATDRSKYGLIDNFFSGVLGKNNSSSASKLGNFFGKYSPKANNPILVMRSNPGYIFGSWLGKKLKRK